jgi:NAD(P)-dependent dehydrogenase (short-subunit alcohol dehydrogenase family)
LVTGANRGLGRAYADALLASGAAKVYAAARDPSAISDARLKPIRLDVTSPTDIAAAVKACPDVNLLINNAGVMLKSPMLAEGSEDALRREMEVNVYGVLPMVRAFAPILARNGGGALVDIHSALSWLAQPGAYPSTKAALWSVTNSLRLELAGQGIQVVGAHLGYADTPMTAKLDVAKADPRDIVAAIYDGLEAGELEVLADDPSRWVKQQLSQPLSALYPELAASS